MRRLKGIQVVGVTMLLIISLIILTEFKVILVKVVVSDASICKGNKGYINEVEVASDRQVEDIHEYQGKYVIVKEKKQGNGSMIFLFLVIVILIFLLTFL